MHLIAINCEGLKKNTWESWITSGSAAIHQLIFFVALPKLSTFSLRAIRYDIPCRNRYLLLLSYDVPPTVLSRT